MSVSVFAADSNTEEATASAEFFKSDTDVEEFNGFSDFKKYKEFSRFVSLFLMICYLNNSLYVALIYPSLIQCLASFMKINMVLVVKHAYIQSIIVIYSVIVICLSRGNVRSIILSNTFFPKLRLRLLLLSDLV